MKQDRINEAIAKAIDNHRTQKVDIDVCMLAMQEAEHTLVGSIDAREVLLASLTVLEENNTIRFPSAKSKTAWDRTGAPDLPKWVMRNRPSSPSPPPVTRAVVYPTVLEPAVEQAKTPKQWDLLNRIASWMKDDPHPTYIPVQERSLRLLGNEKKLQDISKSWKLFKDKLITFDMLACYEVATPLPTIRLPGVGPTTLIILENSATYDSVRNVYEAQPEQQRPDLYVGFGWGDKLPSSLRSITYLDPAPEEIVYFGDIDARGLAIAHNAANVIATMPQFPSLQPATRWYQWLLDHGTLQPSDSSASLSTITTHTAWLPPHQQEHVTEILRSQQRIAQETLSYGDFIQHPRLLEWK